VVVGRVLPYRVLPYRVLVCRVLPYRVLVRASLGAPPPDPHRP